MYLLIFLPTSYYDWYNALTDIGNLNIILYQYLNDKNAAAPALIQTSSSSLEGNSRGITKLVECPVVERVPA
jgi:hypothetical protein